MKRKLKKAFISIVTTAVIGIMPTVAAHPGYIAEVSGWAVHHPAAAARVLAKGELWCQSCGEPYPVEMLGWFDLDGDALLVCDGCYDAFTAGM